MRHANSLGGLLNRLILIILVSSVSFGYVATAVYGTDQPFQDGVLRVPVTRDGQVSQGEYADATPYKFSGNPDEFTGNFGNFGVMYVKHDGNWTYFGLDFEASLMPRTNDLLQVGLDPAGTGVSSNSTLVLGLLSSAPKVFQEDSKAAGELKPLQTVFPNDDCRHYCWQYYFGPSANYPMPHQQFEVQVRNDVLFGQANPIGLIIDFRDEGGTRLYVIGLPMSGPLGELQFVSQ